MNIFERLSQGFNIEREVQNIWNIFHMEKNIIVSPDARDYLPVEHKNYTVLEYINKYIFSNWKSRGTCVSCEDMIERLEIRKIIDEKDYLKQECSLIVFLEFIMNMIYLCDINLKDQVIYSWKQDYQILTSNLCELLDKCLYDIKFFPEMEKLIVVEKNSLANHAASIVNEAVAEKIVKYNHILYRGNIDEKRDILLTLARELEPREKELKETNSKIKDNIFFLLNNLNIRHENITPETKNYKEYIAKMDGNKLEKWYDDTYYLLLIALSLLNNNERNKRIDDLKKELKEKAIEH